jgi:hypothetical protein
VHGEWHPTRCHLNGLPPEQLPSEEFEASVHESERKLLIVCGQESRRSFWTWLFEEGVLYAGSDFPPRAPLSPRCIVIPNSVCVTAIIKDRDFNNFPKSNRTRLVHRCCRRKFPCVSRSPPLTKGGRGISPVLYTPVYQFDVLQFNDYFRKFRFDSGDASFHI